MDLQKGGCASLFDIHNKQHVLSDSDLGSAKSIKNNTLIVNEINQFLNLNYNSFYFSLSLL